MATIQHWLVPKTYTAPEQLRPLGVEVWHEELADLTYDSIIKQVHQRLTDTYPKLSIEHDVAGTKFSCQEN